MLYEAEDADLIVLAETVSIEIFGFFEQAGAFIGRGGEGDATDGKF